MGGVWRPIGSDAPTPRYRFDSAVLNGRLYLTGGYEAGTGWVPGESALSRVLSATCWFQWRCLTQPLGPGPQALQCAQRVISTAPWCWATSSTLPAEILELMRPRENGTCRRGADMCTRRANDRSVEMFDPATENWSTAPPMLKARTGHSSVALDGKLYVTGGFILDTG